MTGRRPATWLDRALAEDPHRDATTIRRALRAGLVVWALVGGLWIAAVVAGGGGGRAGLVGLVSAMVVGAMVASAWLLVALFLDLLADHRPGRRRLAWTFAVVVFTLLSPVLILGAQGAEP